MVSENKTASRRKKSISYVDRLKLAKKNKKSRKKSRRFDENEGADVETAVLPHASRTVPNCEISSTSPRKSVSDSDPHAHSSSSSSNTAVGVSSFHSLSLRLEDTYSNNRLSDATSDLDEPVRASINKSLYHDKTPSGESTARGTVNESVRWELSLESPDDEKERLRVYKLNRRKRYLAKRHLLAHVQEQPVIAMQSKMAQIKLTVSPRKGGR